MQVEEHTAEIDGLPVHWLSAPVDGTPPLYVHGVPNAGGMWRTFLARTGGFAIDLPGFGRSGKPAHFDFSIAGYEAFLPRMLERIGIERCRLVVHDWGAVALRLPPSMIERLVLIDAVPLLAGYRWHRVARIWRRPLAGELAMGTTTPWLTRQIATRVRDALPAEHVEDVVRDFDFGTQRAILRLYRSADPDVLASAGEHLGALDAPALVIWGDRDPYIPVRFAQAYADALGGPAEVEIVAGAGHWPWVQHPDLVERIASFLA